MGSGLEPRTVVRIRAPDKRFPYALDLSRGLDRGRRSFLDAVGYNHGQPGGTKGFVVLPVFFPPRGPGAILIAVAVLATYPAVSTAHGPVHDQIELVSRDIQQSPDYAELYLVRADLYRLDRDWSRAESDLASAERLNARGNSVAMMRVEIALDRGRHQDALELLIPLRRQATTEVQFSHVRAYRGLGDLRSALVWLDLCLKAPEAVPADWYLLRARLILEVDPENTGEALAGLQDGLDRRGFDVSLAMTALDLEVASGRFDEALTRLSDLEAVYLRDEELLSRRGDILERTGRHLEAEAAYTEALSALESLPPSHRSTPATQDLEGHLRTALEKRGTH